MTFKKNSFHEFNDHVKFYGSLSTDKLKKFAQKFITMFGNTYLCEQTFSILKPFLEFRLQI